MNNMYRLSDAFNEKYNGKGIFANIISKNGRFRLMINKLNLNGSYVINELDEEYTTLEEVEAILEHYIEDEYIPAA